MLRHLSPAGPVCTQGFLAVEFQVRHLCDDGLQGADARFNFRVGPPALRAFSELIMAEFTDDVTLKATVDGRVIVEVVADRTPQL